MLTLDNTYDIVLPNELINNPDNYENVVDKNLIVKKYTCNKQKYKIIKYNKEKYNNLDYIDKLNYINLRSCILDETDRLIVVSPEKSIDYYEFTKNNTINDCYHEAFIDGIMINVFYDNVNNVWEIATRSTVGGNNYFYDDYTNSINAPRFNIDRYTCTFRNLFFETCNLKNFNLNELPKEFSYTFVLQHPLNRIVTPVATPDIYLVRIIKIEQKSSTNYTVSKYNISNFYNKYFEIFSKSKLNFIKQQEFNPGDTFDNVYKYFNEGNCDFYCVGVMIYNKSGLRTKIRNPKYNEVKLLRGNQPKLQYNYLCLKKENQVSEFLQYYPEHKKIFNDFKNKIYNYTNNLYVAYINCYIKKLDVLVNFPFEYKIHMYNLHKIFKDSIANNNKKIIDKKTVIDYVNNLHPAQQMFVINYCEYNNIT